MDDNVIIPRLSKCKSIWKDASSMDNLNLKDRVCANNKYDFKSTLKLEWFNTRELFLGKSFMEIAIWLVEHSG